MCRSQCVTRVVGLAEVLGLADKGVVASLDQFLSKGELHHAVEHGVMVPARVYAELGDRRAERQDVVRQLMTVISVAKGVLFGIMARVGFEHVGKRFDGDVAAVEDFCLDVADGEFMVLVGPSGCG